MIEQAFIISLKITCIYVLFMEGMLLHKVRVAGANFTDKVFGKKNSCYIQKPIWCCLPCMGSLWTILLSWSFDINLILIVCGINVIIDNYIDHEL